MIAKKYLSFVQEFRIDLDLDLVFGVLKWKITAEHQNRPRVYRL